jgi:transcription termination/antitermination protein NusG
MDDENIQNIPDPQEPDFAAEVIDVPEGDRETVTPAEDLEVEPVGEFEEKIDEATEEGPDSSEAAVTATEIDDFGNGPVDEANEPDAADEDADDGSDLAPVVSGEKKWSGQWYVLHTYSGYEDAVAESLKQRISSLDMQDKIFDVMVPKENQIEIKNGKRKTVEKKMFPGYVLVNMNVTEDSWYVVRNTPNVTGFIGSGTVPVPIAESELSSIFKRMEIEEPKYKIDLAVGDLVNIKDGPFKNYDGSVSEVDDEKGKIKVLVSIFGRETPVELDFLQVKKV